MEFLECRELAHSNTDTTSRKNNLETSFKISCTYPVLPFTQTYPTDNAYDTCKDICARVVSEGLCVCVHSVMSHFCHPMDYSLPGYSVHDSPGKNTGVGCHFLLQEIFLFLTQELNLWLLSLFKIINFFSSDKTKKEEK